MTQEKKSISLVMVDGCNMTIVRPMQARDVNR